MAIPSAQGIYGKHCSNISPLLTTKVLVSFNLSGHFFIIMHLSLGFGKKITAYPSYSLNTVPCDLFDFRY
jgi:hypothetical protein